MWDLSTLPAGLHQEEITDVRIAETVRQGSIEVFYNLGTEGREGLYHMILAVVTGFVGNGLLGYHIRSVWVSLLAMALVYALVLRLFGALAGVSALALLAVNFYFILAGREIEREILLPLVITGIVFGLARGLSVYRSATPRIPLNANFAALGLLLGLGFYIHPAHFLIALFSALFIIYRLRARQQVSEQAIAYLRFSLLVMVIIATPYLISSIRLPELSGFRRLWNVTQVPPLQAYIDGLGGLFFIGDNNPLHNIPGRPLIDLFSGLFLLIGFLTALQNWRKPRYALPLIATLVLSPFVLISDNSPDFKRFLVALPLIAVFFGLGVASLYRTIRARAVHRVFSIGLVGLVVFNLVWLIPDLFERWPQQPEVYVGYNVRLGQIAHYLDRTAGSLPPLICDTNPTAANPTSTLRQSDLILLMMNRKTVTPRFSDCGSGFVFINGGDGQQVVLPAANTLEFMHPYLKGWVNQGKIVSEADLPPDAIVNLAVSGALADRVGRFMTTAPVTYAPESPGGEATAAPPIAFGSNLTFLGYEMPTVDYTPGGIVTLITYWRTDGTIPPDLRLFTHVLSDPISPAAQTDTISVDVQQLQSRDIFVQITFVPLPLSIPEGTYSISIGAYRRGDSGRLPVLKDGQPHGERLFLGQITVRSTNS
jgi:hypothetical protein